MNKVNIRLFIGYMLPFALCNVLRWPAGSGNRQCNNLSARNYAVPLTANNKRRVVTYRKSDTGTGMQDTAPPLDINMDI